MRKFVILITSSHSIRYIVGQNFNYKSTKIIRHFTLYLFCCDLVTSIISKSILEEYYYYDFKVVVKLGCLDRLYIYFRLQ